MSDIEVFKPKTSPIDVLNNYKFTEDEIKKLESVYTKEWDLYVKGLTQFIDQSILDKVEGIKLCVSKITTGDPDKWIDTNEVFSEAKHQAFVKWLFKSHIMALRDCDRAIGNSIDHHLPILFRIYINEGRYKRLMSEDLPETAKIEDFNKLTKLTIDTLNEAIGPYFELDVVSGVTTEDRFQYIPVNVKMKTIYQESEDAYIKTFLAHLVAERNKQTGLEEFHPMYDIGKSSENILEKIQIGFGAVLVAYCIFQFVIIPIYKHTPLYKYIENKRKEKEKEIEKQRQKDRKIEINEKNKLVQELKTNPQLKHLQSEIKRTVDLANSFGKSLVPVLRTELKKIDPKNYIKVFDYSSDNNVTDKMTDVLWDMCFEIAKAVQNKTDVDVFFECNSFGIDGLKQYTIDDDNDDSDNRKFNKVFESTVENHCRKFKIPGISVESEGYGDCSNDTIYYNRDWGGDHHGTIQSLVNMIHLDFSNDTGREDLEYSEELFGFGKKKEKSNNKEIDYTKLPGFKKEIFEKCISLFKRAWNYKAYKLPTDMGKIQPGYEEQFDNEDEINERCNECGFNKYIGEEEGHWIDRDPTVKSDKLIISGEGIFDFAYGQPTEFINYNKTLKDISTRWGKRLSEKEPIVKEYLSKFYNNVSVSTNVDTGDGDEGCVYPEYTIEIPISELQKPIKKSKEEIIKLCKDGYNILKKAFEMSGNPKGFKLYSDKEIKKVIDEYINGETTSIWLGKYDAWEFTNGRARDKDQYEKFTNVQIEIENNIKTLSKRLKFPYTITCEGGDWDDGFYEIYLN